MKWVSSVADVYEWKPNFGIEVVDLTLRRGLVAFALTHCPAECIEDLLRLSWHLERRQLTDASVRHMEMLMTYEDGDPAFLALLDADCVDAYRRNADLEGRKSSTTQQLVQFPFCFLYSITEPDRCLLL